MLSQFVERELPAFARPVFIRLQAQLETTVTFKLVKGALRKKAYHLDQTSDSIYSLKPKSRLYARLDNDSKQQVVTGLAGY